MRLCIADMHLRLLLANICMGILCFINAGQHEIPATTLLNYEILNDENGLLRAWHKQHGSID